MNASRFIPVALLVLIIVVIVILVH